MGRPLKAKSIVRNGRSGERSTPLYQHLYMHLRQLIVDAALPNENALPSEPALATQFGVSRVTVRKTLEQLETDGLVRRVRGIGTFPNRSSVLHARKNISGLLENLMSVDDSTTAVNLSWELIQADTDISTVLESKRVLRIVRLRSLAGQPMSLTTLHVPADLAKLLDRKAPADEPVVRVFERHGIVVHRADQTLTARTADAAISAHLNVPIQSPLVCMRRIMFTGDRRPVIHQDSLYAADRFEYRMSLNRASIGTAARWTPI